VDDFGAPDITLANDMDFRAQQRIYFAVTLLLLSTVLVLHFLVLPRVQVQSERLEGRLQKLVSTKASQATKQGLEPQKNIFGELDSFNALSAISGDLQSLAGKNGIALSEASFKPLTDLADGQVGRVEISAHLRGAYPPLKKTIGEMLASYQSLSLTSISVARVRSTDSATEADLRFVFYFRKQV